MNDVRNVLSGHSWFLEYCEKCKSGEELVGRDILCELERIKNVYDCGKYEIKLSESQKRIDFIEHECKFYEAPFAGKPFKLMLFQKAFIESVFAPHVFDDELGRYVRLCQEVFFEVGRKNGKSPLVAAMCLAEWFCGEIGLKILCASNDYEQADIMFQAINAMREESPKLERVTRKNIKGIFFGNPKQGKKHGKFSLQNKGSIRKLSAKTGAKEGKNIGVGAVDEIHEMKDESLIMPIRQALSTQDEPLYFELTTEGFVVDGYLDKRTDKARSILRGEEENDRWRIWIYSQDNENEIWQNEKSWVKSNPSLGVAKKWSFLRQMVDEARRDKGTRAFVLAKDFNIKQNNADVWLSPAEIENKETFDLKDFAGCTYIGGEDFAETTDLCSAKCLFLRDGKKYIYQHYWIPESKIDNALDDKNPERRDYAEWAKQGFITIVKGNEVSVSVVADWHYQLYKDYKVLPFKLGYDNRFAKDFVRRAEEIFGKDIAVNIPQDFKVLSNPMRTAEADFKSKKIIYNNNPIDFWCFCNTAYKLDSVGRIMPCKSSAQSKNRIDGTASLVDCYAGLEWYKSEFVLQNRR